MKRTHLVAALVLPLAAACSTVGYAVPGELHTVAPMRVSGRQGWLLHQRVSFGPYATGVVSRSATRGTEEAEAFATEHGEYRQRYAFSLARGDAKVADVACNAEGSGAQTLSVTWRMKRVLRCEATMADGSLRAIRLDSSNDRPLAGRVSGSEGWAVTGSNRVGVGVVSGTAGYTIAEDDGSPLAAVDVSNDGTVYMAGGESDTVAAIAAALLLYQDPLQASERFRDP
jgi:hypothetical protein